MARKRKKFKSTKVGKIVSNVAKAVTPKSISTGANLAKASAPALRTVGNKIGNVATNALNTIKASTGRNTLGNQTASVGSVSMNTYGKGSTGSIVSPKTFKRLEKDTSKGKNVGEYSSLFSSQAKSPKNYSTDPYTTEQRIAMEKEAELTAGNQPYEAAERLPGESDAESFKLAKDMGLSGLGYDETFGGLTASQARDKANSIKAKLSGQVSANTGFSFNQDFMAGIRKASENLNAKLKDTANDGWLSEGSKEENKKILTESTAAEIAKLFPSLDEFNKQYTGNMDVRKAIDTFKSVGGDINSITSRITDPTVVTATVENQDLATYLEKLNPTATESQKKAYQLLLPERELAQAEIMQLASIPKEYRDLYFGTPEQIGILEEKKIQAEETKKLLEKKAKQEEKNLRAQAQFAIDKNNADMEIAAATIEENRLQSKNYMTGMLAKMGALNTTGAAPQAIATLEEKYQKQALQLRNQVNMENRNIEMKLNQAINEVEIQRDEAILDIESDLTLDKEQVFKEIMKLEASSNKAIFDILGRYTKEFRTTSEKYAKEAKAAAAKYTKELANTISAVDLEGLSEGSYFVKGKTKGVLLPDGSIAPLALTPSQQQQVESAGIRGIDAIRFFITLEPAFRNEFIQANLGQTNMSAPQLREVYNQWKKEQASKKKDKTEDEISIDDL